MGEVRIAEPLYCNSSLFIATLGAACSEGLSLRPFHGTQLKKIIRKLMLIALNVARTKESLNLGHNTITPNSKSSFEFQYIGKL